MSGKFIPFKAINKARAEGLPTRKAPSDDGEMPTATPAAKPVPFTTPSDNPATPFSNMAKRKGPNVKRVAHRYGKRKI